MSETLDLIRKKFPQYADIGDEDLTLRIGSKYPTYLRQDKDFAKEFQDAGGKFGVGMPLEMTGRLTKTLTAGAEGSEMGRGQAQDERTAELANTVATGITAPLEMTGRLTKTLTAGAEGSEMGRQEATAERVSSAVQMPIQGVDLLTNILKAGAEGSEMGREQSKNARANEAALVGLGPSETLAKMKKGLAKPAGEGAAEAVAFISKPLYKLIPDIRKEDLEKLLVYTSNSPDLRMLQERAAGGDAAAFSQLQEHPGTLLSPEARKLVHGVAGVEQSLAATANFFTSPLGLSTFGMEALPMGIQKLVGLAFTAQMASELPPTFRELKAEIAKPENERDYEKISKLTTDAISATGFTALGAVHTIAAEIPRANLMLRQLAAKRAMARLQQFAPQTAAAVHDQQVTFRQQGTDDLSTRPFEIEPEKPKEGPTKLEQITGASYTHPETGVTTTGENHPEAAAKQGVQAPQEPTQRHGPEYGFEVVDPSTGKKKIVTRDEAEAIARLNGQLREEPKRGKLHSDEVNFYGAPEGYVNKNGILVPATGKDLKTPPGAQPHPQQEILDQLIQEGVKREDAEALIAGKKTIQQVVDGNLGMVTPSRDFSQLADNPSGSFGHADAMEEGYRNAQARLAQILEPLQKAAEAPKAETPSQKVDRVLGTDTAGYAEHIKNEGGNAQVDAHRAGASLTYRADLDKLVKAKAEVQDQIQKLLNDSRAAGEAGDQEKATALLNDALQLASGKSQWISEAIEGATGSADATKMAAITKDVGEHYKPPFPTEPAKAELPQPPTKPVLKDFRDAPNHFKAFSDAVGQWKQKVIEWAKQFPENKAMVFQTENSIYAVTRDPKGGWRYTYFSRLDKMPSGHDEFKTRDEAISELLRNNPDAKLIEKMPFTPEPLGARIYPNDKAIWHGPDGDVSVTFNGFLGGEQAGKSSITLEDGTQKTVDNMDVAAAPKAEPAADVAGKEELAKRRQQISQDQIQKLQSELGLNTEQVANLLNKTTLAADGKSLIIDKSEFEKIAKAALREKGFDVDKKSVVLNEEGQLSHESAMNQGIEEALQKTYEILNPKVEESQSGLRRALALTVDKEFSNPQFRNEALAKGEPVTEEQADLSKLTKGKPLFHETSLANAFNVFKGLLRPFKQSWTRFFASDNPDLALGQEGQKGVLFELDPTRVNGYRHPKPGTTEQTGFEYNIDRTIKKGVKSITFATQRQLEAFQKRFPKSFDYENPVKTERGLQVKPAEAKAESSAPEVEESAEAPEEPKSRSYRAINKDIRALKEDLKARKAQLADYRKAKDKGAIAAVQDKIREAQNKLADLEAELSRAPKPKSPAGGSVAERQFAKEDALVGDDILKFIKEESGRIMSFSAFKEKAKSMGKEWFERNKSLYDDLKRIRLPIHHNKAIYGGSQLPDQIVDAAYNAGKLSEPSVNALADAIEAASKKRLGSKKGQAADASAMSDMERAGNFLTAASEQPGRVEVNTEYAVKGDRYVLDGQEITVTGRDADGNLQIDGGEKFGKFTLDGTDDFHVDSVKEAAAPEGDADFLGDKDKEETPEEKLHREAAEAKAKVQKEWPPVYQQIVEATGLSRKELDALGIPHPEEVSHPSEVENLAKDLARNAPGGRLNKLYDLLAGEGQTGRFSWGGTAEKPALAFDPDVPGAKPNPEAAKKALDAVNKIRRVFGFDPLPDFFTEKPVKPKSLKTDLFGNPLPEEEGEVKHPELGDVAERALTKAEQEEFEALTLKDRAAREKGGEALTSEETKRYQYLTKLAGQRELLAEDSSAGIKGRMTRMKSDLAELHRQRDLSIQRAQESYHRREEYTKEAGAYDAKIKDLEKQIFDLNQKLPVHERDFNNPNPPSKPRWEGKTLTGQKMRLWGHARNTEGSLYPDWIVEFAGDPRERHTQEFIEQATGKLVGDLLTEGLSFKPGQKVMIGEGYTAREGEVTATGPFKDGEQHYFVRTQLGETAVRESDLRQRVEEPPKGQQPSSVGRSILAQLSEDKSGTHSPSRTKLYQELGADAVPGIRLGDAEEAGRLFEMLQKGDATPAEWDKWVADAKASNRVAEPKGKAAAAPEPPKPADPTGGKYRIGNNPQTYTMLERLAPSEIERQNGEQPVRVRNDKTGREEIVMEGDLTPVKERTKEERAAAKPKDLNSELRAVGLDLGVFRNNSEKRAALKRAKAKGEGPGSPSITQGPDPKAQIEQLADSMKGVRGKRVPLRQQIREAFALGERLSAARTAVGQAIGGLKSTGDYLIAKWAGYDQLDDLLLAKGELSAELEKRGWRVRQFVKTVERNVPDKKERAAIAKWVDAGGDINQLQQGYNEAPTEYKQAYQDAQNLSGDLLIAAHNIRNFFDARLQEAIDAGVLQTGVEDYLHRLYEKDPAAAKKITAYVQSGLLSPNPSLAKKRIFEHDWEAEKLGLKVVQDVLPRITAYETSLSRAIAAREFIRKALDLTAKDGRPVIDTMGLGIPVDDATGVREATLINPSFKRGEDLTNPLLRRNDYRTREYPALREWKWASEDATGAPIIVKGDLAVHPDFVGRIDALLKPSAIRYAENPTARAVGRFALGASSTVKQTMLDLSMFHQVQIAIHAAEHRVFPQNVIKEMDFTNPDVEGLLRGGVTIGGEYFPQQAAEGLVGRSLSNYIPGLGKVLETYHQYLFQDFIPRVKMTMALDALERNQHAYAKELASGKMRMEDIYHLTANQANAAFGELNYTMLERSKTAQDISRLIMLAPDFLEARGRFAAQAFQKHGKEQRVALALGALVMWSTARILNMALDGQMHNEPENLFSLVYKGKSYGLRTVQGDILHLFTRPIQFAMSRLNPVYGRTLLEMATGRDYFGRKRSALEQIWDFVSTSMPISLRTNQERGIWESTMNAFGVTARRFSDADTAFKLAEKWKEKHGVQMKGEFIYDSSKDPLRGLKVTLANGDESGAARELVKLLKKGEYTVPKINKYFSSYATKPFTGSFDNDRKWIKGLSEDEKKTVQSAKETKKSIEKLWRRVRGQYQAAVGEKPAPGQDNDSGSLSDEEWNKAAPQ